ncbi:energy transducer TonB [Thaumasiovibrio sp. DFM-14]|uniref:energy transducer TonB n=1 Tax=Thaumasiovibrio sp. DFM-14 TaxID=3384792 RepID=UPI0039A36ABD
MWRLLSALPLALAAALSLFTVMAWMVNPVKAPVRSDAMQLSFDMVMMEPEQTVQRRQRLLPDKPIPPPAAQSLKPVIEFTALTLPELPLLSPTALAIEVGEVAMMVPSVAEYGLLGQEQQVMPLYRVEPAYPARALRQRLEGKVTLSFTIDKQGQPKDIQVVAAEPARVFDREAISALRRWRYQPRIVDGVAVAQPDRTVSIEFNLDK